MLSRLRSYPSADSHLGYFVPEAIMAFGTLFHKCIKWKSIFSFPFLYFLFLMCYYRFGKNKKENLHARINSVIRRWFGPANQGW